LPFASTWSPALRMKLVSAKRESAFVRFLSIRWCRFPHCAGADLRSPPEWR
jgi:hypothetical protein